MPARYLLTVLLMVLALLLIENRNYRNRVREMEVLSLQGKWPPKELIKRIK